MSNYIYHYTSMSGLKGIIESGCINLGIFTTADDPKIIYNYAISLTTDLSPYGHGLTVGEEINQQQAIYLGEFSEGHGDHSGKLFSVNRIKFRLKIDLDKVNLTSAVDYYKVNSKVLRALEITALYPLLDSKVKENNDFLVIKGNDPSIQGKGDTWYFSFSPINIKQSVVAIQFLNSEEMQYIEYDLDSFLYIWQSEANK